IGGNFETSVPGFSFENGGKLPPFLRFGMGVKLTPFSAMTGPRQYNQIPCAASTWLTHRSTCFTVNCRAGRYQRTCFISRNTVSSGKSTENTPAEADSNPAGAGAGDGTATSNRESIIVPAIASA